MKKIAQKILFWFLRKDRRAGFARHFDGENSHSHIEFGCPLISINRRSKFVPARGHSAGFTLLYAVLVGGLLAMIGAAIFNLAIKEISLSITSRESEVAFYAADTGTECAIYWDLKSSNLFGAFSTSSASQIKCNNQTFTVGGGGVSKPSSTFQIFLNTSPYDPCVTIVVTKEYIGGIFRTRIESHGYNTCDTSNPRRVERAIRVTYQN
jgi:hypothetical protein